MYIAPRSNKRDKMAANTAHYPVCRQATAKPDTLCTASTCAFHTHYIAPPENCIVFTINQRAFNTK